MTAITRTVDELNSGFGQDLGSQVAEYKEVILFGILAFGVDALLEVESALGDVVGDGDGDGMCVVDVDIGVDLHGVVSPDHLERRGGVEGESPRTSREIVHGRYCEGVRLNQGRERSFQLQTLPSCSALTFLPAGMTTQSSSENRSTGIETYGKRYCEYQLITKRGVGKIGGGRVSTNLSPDEGHLFSTLGDDEGSPGVLVIQHGPELEDLQILVANVLDGSDDPQFGHGRDLVGGSREGNLKTTGGAGGRIGISTDGRKTKSKERQTEHNGAKESKGSLIGA